MFALISMQSHGSSQVRPIQKQRISEADLVKKLHAARPAIERRCMKHKPQLNHQLLLTIDQVLRSMEEIDRVSHRNKMRNPKEIHEASLGNKRLAEKPVHLRSFGENNRYERTR
jgi:hypothetical protein